jgi:hypothetical protein
VYLPIWPVFLTEIDTAAPARRKPRIPGKRTSLVFATLRARANGQLRPTQRTVILEPIDVRTSSVRTRAPRRSTVPAMRTIGKGLMSDGAAGGVVVGVVGAGAVTTVVAPGTTWVTITGSAGGGTGPTVNELEALVIASSSSVTRSVTVCSPSVRNDVLNVGPVPSTLPSFPTSHS